jgi:hypothetical protein
MPKMQGGLLMNEFNVMRANPVTAEEFATAVKILSSTSAVSMQEFILAKNPLMLEQADRAVRKLTSAVKATKRVRNV